jgi:hypothetical protein
MKKAIVLGVVMVVLGLGGPALAQTQKTPEAAAAQMQAAPKPAPDGLVKLLESKGILTDAEAAIISDTALQPQTKQVLAEMLLSKHLITEKEYDQTIDACSSTDAQATPSADPGSGQPARSQAPRHLFWWGGGGEGAGVPMSLSDWISSILPGGTDDPSGVSFGTIEPSPMWPPGEEPQKAPAKDKHKSKKHHRHDASQTTPGPGASVPKQ